MELYVQCRMENIDNRIDVAWIEKKHAEVNKILKIKKDDGSWDEGWVVKATYGTMTAEQMVFERDKHRHHRKATDI